MNFILKLNIFIINSHTLSLGDNDCVILLLFVVVDSIIGDDRSLTICGKWDVESTTRLDILFVAVIFVDAYEWCWLETLANVDESIEDDREEYVPLGIADDGPVLLASIEPGVDEFPAVNNVGINDLKKRWIFLKLFSFIKLIYMDF